MCSGKTSLLEILGGRNSPTQGGLLSDNRYYDDSTKMSVGFVPQVHKTDEETNALIQKQGQVDTPRQRDHP